MNAKDQIDVHRDSSSMLEGLSRISLARDLLVGGLLPEIYGRHEVTSSDEKYED